jgi:hypothetical protein
LRLRGYSLRVVHQALLSQVTIAAFQSRIGITRSSSAPK